MGGAPTITMTAPGWFVTDSYHADLARLRNLPSLEQSTEGWWLLARYDEVRAVSRDPQRFRSGQGVLVNDPLREEGGGAAAGFVSLLHMDPPEHGAYRKLLHRAFTPRAVLRRADGIRRVVRDVLAPLEVLPRGSTVEVVDQVAAPIPIGVICDMLGVPGTDRAQFRRWSDATIEGPDRSPEQRAADAADLAEMAGFLLELIESPTVADASLLSMLRELCIDGRRLTRAEVMGFCITLLIAGNETTRALIAGGLRVLAEHPGQRRRLAVDPTMIPAAVEEMLRWVTPIQAFCRTVAEPVSLAGCDLAVGDVVVMLYASANRDESVFGPTADRFQIDRPVDQSHLAFGFGEHVCLGAALARLEAQIVLEEFLARFAEYEIVSAPQFVPSTLSASIESMSVVLRT